MSESDKEFVERMDAVLQTGTRGSFEDFDRLFALARRGAAAQWRPIKTDEPPEFKHFLATDGDVRGEAWRSQGRYYWVDDTAAESITHWMPLPPPPKENNDDAL